VCSLTRLLQRSSTPTRSAAPRSLRLLHSKQGLLPVSAVAKKGLLSGLDVVLSMVPFSSACSSMLLNKKNSTEKILIQEVFLRFKRILRV
jgi:hypothetical protein